MKATTPNEESSSTVPVNDKSSKASKNQLSQPSKTDMTHAKKDNLKLNSSEQKKEKKKSGCC